MTKMHILNLLLLLLLPLLSASVSATAVDRIVYTPGPTDDDSGNLPNLVRRDEITWGDDEESQDACDADEGPQMTGGTDIVKWDCMGIENFNNRSGRYTISGFFDKRWAKINTLDTCTIAVSRTDDSTNDFEFGDRDVRECIGAAMDLYMSPVVMQSVTGGATCDAADTSGNDVPIQWRVANPDDIS